MHAETIKGPIAILKWKDAIVAVYGILHPGFSVEARVVAGILLHWGLVIWERLL